MVADVSYLVKIMNEHQHHHHHQGGQGIIDSGKSTAGLITRDLLGGGGGGSLDSSQELDLDLQVPIGWEKRLDLKSGKIYLQRCNSTNATSSSSSSENKHRTNQTVSKLQDLNFPPSSKQPLNLFDDTSLDLKLLPASSYSSPYQSVCTLDKVKSALERGENASVMKKRSMSISMSKSSSSPPRSNSSASCSIKEVVEDECERSSSPASYAAGCPSCLLYVLISKSNPKCPRCNMTVPSPMAMKKPRIDLNISI